MVMEMESGIDSTVFVEDVAITADIGVDCFGRFGKPQPVLVSAYLLFDFSAASKDDDFTKALDYRGINKAIKGLEGWKDGYVQDDPPRGIDGLNLDVFWALCTATSQAATSEIRVRCHAPKAIMHCDGGLTIDTTRTRRLRGDTETFSINAYSYRVDRLRVVCIIGIGKEERVIRQPVLISFEVNVLTDGGRAWTPIFDGVKTLANNIHELVSKTAYQTIEAMIEHVYKFMADFLTAENESNEERCACKISLKITKPSVFSGAAGPGVQIVRTTKAFAERRAPPPENDDTDDSEESEESEEAEIPEAKPASKKRKTK